MSPSYTTSIGATTPDTITVLGRDLARELMGHVGLDELAFWLVSMRRPTPGELRVFQAVLVALADHGLTPSAIAARLTLTGAPDAFQGALAAGLLGGGSRFLGTTEDTAAFLAAALDRHASTGAALPQDDAGWDAIAVDAIERYRAAGKVIPGLGHPQHKGGDPRTPVLIGIARECGTYGPQLRLFEAVGRVHPQILARTLPLNGAGVCGAALSDLGFPNQMLRGFALFARTAGLLGHLAEEQRSGIGQAIALDVHHAAAYVAPPESGL